MLPYVQHESTKSTTYLRMCVNLVYLQHAAVCPTCIYEINYISKNVSSFGLSSTCCHMSYMNLRNMTKCICMDNNIDYLQHAAVCPTRIYEINYISKNVS